MIIRQWFVRNFVPFCNYWYWENSRQKENMDKRKRKEREKKSEHNPRQKRLLWDEERERERERERICNKVNQRANDSIQIYIDVCILSIHFSCVIIYYYSWRIGYLYFPPIITHVYFHLSQPSYTCAFFIIHHSLRGRGVLVSTFIFDRSLNTVVFYS